MSASRADRQQAIRRLVRTCEIRTQSQLVDALRADGIEVAQATVSRDMAMLDLQKGADGAYVLAEDRRLRTMISDAARDVERALNQVVVHTLPGSAPSVAAAIDEARPAGVLGSIAGDDTVLVIASDEGAAQDFGNDVSALLARR